MSHWCTKDCYNKDGSRVCGQGEPVIRVTSEGAVFDEDQLKFMNEINVSQNYLLNSQIELQRLLNHLTDKHKEIEAVHNKILSIKGQLLGLRDKLTISLTTEPSIPNHPNQLQMLDEQIARDE